MTLDKVHSKAGEYDLIRIALPASFLNPEARGRGTVGFRPGLAHCYDFLLYLNEILRKEQARADTPIQLVWDEDILSGMPEKI